jgi:hypothetical protein
MCLAILVSYCPLNKRTSLSGARMLELRHLAHAHLAMSAQRNLIIGFDKQNSFAPRNQSLQFLKHRCRNAQTPQRRIHRNRTIHVSILARIASMSDALARSITTTSRISLP